jgi:hypothetical protein
MSCPVCSGSSEQKAKPSKWHKFALSDEERSCIQRLNEHRLLLKSIKEQVLNGFTNVCDVDETVLDLTNAIHGAIRANELNERDIKNMPLERMRYWLSEYKLPMWYPFPLTSYQRQMNRIRAAILNYESANEQDKAEAREWAKMDSELIDVLNNWPCSNPC